MPVSTVRLQSLNCHGSLKRSSVSSFSLCRVPAGEAVAAVEAEQRIAPHDCGQASSAAAVCRASGSVNARWFFALCAGRADQMPF